MITVGLDVSTSCTGVSVIENGQPLLVGAVRTDHIDSITLKASAVASALYEHVANAFTVDNVLIEESLQAFRPGFSSANTICSLAKMNGIVSLLAGSVLKAPITYVSAQTARRLCGIKIIRGSDKSAKEQALEWVLLNKLSTWSVPLKPKKDEMAEQVKDAADSLVIALAGERLIPDLKRGLQSRVDDTGINSLVSSDVPRESVGKDRCVKIWKGSGCTLSVTILPIEKRSKKAKASDKGV